MENSQHPQDHHHHNMCPLYFDMQLHQLEYLFKESPEKLNIIRLFLLFMHLFIHSVNIYCSLVIHCSIKVNGGDSALALTEPAVQTRRTIKPENLIIYRKGFDKGSSDYNRSTQRVQLSFPDEGDI